ncbi:MAG: carbon-nitrogen hydrolase family protein [Caldilineaceae bacterium]|nr:carbon-nitrogen hydrolase family protein [Caldilineaceae bacterium]
MPREVTIALVQMAPELANPEANLRKMGDFVEQICSEQQTDLIVFPELSYTGAELGLRATDLAERVPGHATNYLAKRANDFNTHVVFGLVIKEKVESILYNGLVCLGPEGDVAGEYRKVHLLGEERQVYRNGFRFITVDAEWGRFGLSSGTDLAFPETARSLTLDGAELVVVSANWEEQYGASWSAHLISRACENAIFVAAANRVGEEPTMRFLGNSLLVGPGAEVYTMLDEPIEGYAVATIDLEKVRNIREDRQLIQYREPNAYRAVVKKY